MQANKSLIMLFLSILLFASCKFYSFTGASIPIDAKTVSIGYFNNKAATITPSLSQIFTERLKDMFLEQTNLSLSDNEGDLAFSGYISKYQIKPMAIIANETAAKNRLTIVVKVNYNNSFDASKNFEQTFSSYKDYDSSQNLSEVETVLIEEITNQLVEDIFNKAVVNW